MMKADDDPSTDSDHPLADDDPSTQSDHPPVMRKNHEVEPGHVVVSPTSQNIFALVMTNMKIEPLFCLSYIYISLFITLYQLPLQIQDHY